MESRCGAYTRRMIGGFSLEQLHDRLQKKVQEVRTGVHSGQPLWHPKYCPHDGDSISDIVFRAYDFLVEKVHTLDEVPGVPGGGITLIPYLAQVYIATDRWVRALLGGYPLFIEKSRRMVVSWTLAALELWLGGWRRSHIYVAAQDFADSAKMLYRTQFMYEQLRLRNPEWKLGNERTWEYRGSRQLSGVLLPNGSMFESLTGHDPNSFRQEGATVVRLEEAAFFPNFEDIMANARRMGQGRAGSPPGLIVVVSTPSDLPSWGRHLKPLGITRHEFDIERVDAINAQLHARWHAREEVA